MRPIQTSMRVNVVLQHLQAGQLLVAQLTLMYEWRAVVHNEMHIHVGQTHGLGEAEFALVALGGGIVAYVRCIEFGTLADFDGMIGGWHEESDGGSSGDQRLMVNSRRGVCGQF